jgi:histidine ammonia-lyase
MKHMQDPPSVQIDGRHLTIDDVHTIARDQMKVSISQEAIERVERSAETVRRVAAAEAPVYGVNTGFGIFSDRRIDADKSASLSRNLVLSHAISIGEPFPIDVVRAAMAIRANTFACGYSGVRTIIIETLLKMLNREVTPFIPCQGSLGSSGDLTPLANMALVFSYHPLEEQKHSGRAWFQGDLIDGEKAMALAGIDRIVLGPKEGLAITNGATFSAAILSLACIDIQRVLLSAEISAAMVLESLLGASNAFDLRLHDARPHPGQVAVARRIRALTSGSDMIDSDNRVQDAYSLRCTPQVLGPAWETLHFTTDIVSREINSATDNPLIFGDDTVSGGNFHGEPLGLAADYLKISLTNIASMAERRIYRLTDAHTSAGLPPMLVSCKEEAGLHSGFMMLQYVAASLALENQTLATPDTIHSLPTSAGQEDFNANSTTAARHLTQILSNLTKVLAIELLSSTRAIDLRLKDKPDLKLAKGTSLVHQFVRDKIPFHGADRPITNEIELLANDILSGELFEAVADELGDTFDTA